MQVSCASQTGSDVDVSTHPLSNDVDPGFKGGNIAQVIILADLDGGGSCFDDGGGRAAAAATIATLFS